MLNIDVLLNMDADVDNKMIDYSHNYTLIKSAKESLVKLDLVQLHVGQQYEIRSVI